MGKEDIVKIEEEEKLIVRAVKFGAWKCLIHIISTIPTATKISEIKTKSGNVLNIR